MTTSCRFSNTELTTAAFHLLTSSTIERYHRMAERVGMHSCISDRIRETPQVLPYLEIRAYDLWTALLKKEVRDVEEVELAMLMVLLARTGVNSFRFFLSKISSVDRHSVAWISALARRLLTEGAVNGLLQCNKFGGFEMNISCSPDQATSSQEPWIREDFTTATAA